MKEFDTRSHFDERAVDSFMVNNDYGEGQHAAMKNIAGIDEGTNSMSQLSGVVSLFFIGMAFLSSCSPQESPKGNITEPFAILHDQ